MRPMRIGLGTELGLQAALRGLVLVFAPYGPRRAGVADEARVLHRAKRQRVVATTEETVDLDGGAAIAGNDRDVAHGAAPNPARARLRPVIDPFIDWIERHVHRLAGPGWESWSGYAEREPYLNGRFVPWACLDGSSSRAADER